MWKQGALGCLILSLIMGAPAFATPVLSVNEVAGFDNLPLDGEGSASEHIIHVVDVNVSTAEPNGYTLSISSGSLGKSGGQNISFQVMAVDNNASSPSSGDFNIASGNSYIICETAAKDLDIYVKYQPAALQDPGNYTHSVTITAEDNSSACS